jgi:hypothetical protein
MNWFTLRDFITRKSKYMKKTILSAMFAVTAVAFVAASDASPVTGHYDQQAVITNDTIPGQHRKKDSSWNRKKYPDTTQRNKKDTLRMQ